MPLEVHPDGINALVYGDHGAPKDILGLHKLEDGTYVVRAYKPGAERMTLVSASGKEAMDCLHEGGLFQRHLNAHPGKDYSFEAAFPDGQTERFRDPYLAPPLLTDYDTYLWSQGNFLYSYEKLGAHFREVDGVKGVNFAVWAPNARKVAVVGDFNNWDNRAHPMTMHEPSGIWEVFVPDVGKDARYKFEIRSHHQDYRAEKADPYGFASELRPNTASIVTDISDYDWSDSVWMETRAERDMLSEPMTVYEVHLGSWQQHADGGWLTYRELGDTLIPYVRDMGYTHIELMPVAEHPFDGSWGYQVTGYYAPTHRHGTPQDFMYFVDQCHQNGIGVILDWVPAHFPKDGFALSYFDGTHLYEHQDTRLGEHPDWGTYIFNYGRNEVNNFLVSNALFWLEKYHIDGLRVDAVSSMLYLNFGREDGEWIPNRFGGSENLDAVDFLKRFNEVVHQEYPGAVTIAEESTSWPMVSRPTYLGGLGFTFKWNMGWMHDTLNYISKDPVHRRYHHNNLTFSLVYAFTENFVLALSHDEVVHGKGSMINKTPGDWWQKFATLRLLYGYQLTHPGKKLNFMGQEFGQWREWSETRSLDWHLLEFPTHTQLQQWVNDLNHFYQGEHALFEVDFDEEGFRWIEANDADHSVYAYIRYAKDKSDFLVVVVNFTPVPRYNYRVGVPEPGYYAEVLNSDSAYYGGGNVGNDGGLQTEHIGWQGFGTSLNMTIPPLGFLVFKRQ